MIHRKSINITIHVNPALHYFDISFNTFRNFDFSVAHYIMVAHGLQTFKAVDTKLAMCNYNVSTKAKILREFDMSGWICDRLNPRFLHGFPNLSFLNASNCMISQGFRYDKGGEFLVHSKRLHTLNLSHNTLSEDHLHPNLFRQQMHLVKLYLNNNNFRHLPRSISNLNNAELIDFRFNIIEYFDDDDMLVMSDLSNTLFDFSNNSFDCSCKREKGLRWINDNRKSFNGLEFMTCFEKTTRLIDVLNNFRYFQIRCLSQFWLDFAVSSSLILIISILIAALSYRHKDVVVYFYLKALRYLKQEKDRTTCHSFQYDVFLSYSDKDYEWVMGCLYPKLESMGLNVCLHHRNFVVGDGIAENIVRFIDESKRAVFVVTRHFVASHWGTFEMEMARNHVIRYSKRTDNNILVIMKDPISKEEMSDVLRDIWYRITCLEWPQIDNDERESEFWRRLQETLQ